MVDVARLPSNIKVGDMVLLETLMNSNATALGSSEARVTLNLLADNQKIPLEPKGELPLKFDTSSARQFVAKVVSENTLQLVLDRKLPQTDTPFDRGSAVIKETNVSLPQAKPLPLSGQQITAQVMKELNLPQPLQTEVNRLLPPSAVSVRIENPAAAQTEYPILQPLKAAVQNLASAVTENNTPQIMLARSQVEQALHNLVAQKFVAATLPATTAGAPEPALRLDSPLGQIQLETALKLPPETRLEIAVTHVQTGKLPPRTELPLQALEKIFARPELADIFPKADHHRLLNLLQDRDEAVSNLLKIFEPLQNSPQLALSVLQKLPTFNKSILSNIHAFYKGARSQDTEIWLGREVVADLQSAGQRGQAVLRNLQDLVSASVRENPVWRLIEIPLFDGSQMIPFKLSVKKDRENEDSPKSRNKEKGVRFMIETDFSKLGAFQLDGFSVIKDRRLDLVVRTSKMQSDDFCAHIINLFKTSLYNVGYVGNIAVNQKEAFVKTEADSPANLPEGVFV